MLFQICIRIIWLMILHACGEVSYRMNKLRLKFEIIYFCSVGNLRTFYFTDENYYS